MKNFALLLSSLAVASSAFAAAPEVNTGFVSAGKTSMELVKASSHSAAYGKTKSEKSFTKSKKIAAKAPAKAPALSVSYEEPAGLFSLGMSEERGSYKATFRKGPAYTPLKWTNTSTGATEFEWEMISDFSTGETAIYKTVDLVREELYCTEDGPVLYGMDADGNAGVFQIGAESNSNMELSDPNISYFFGGGCSLNRDDPSVGITTYMYSQNTTSWIGVDFMQFANDSDDVDPNSHLDPIFTTPEPNGFGLKDPKFVAYANRFHAPAAPYLISKMWCWMSIKVNKPTVVEMNLYRIDEDGDIDFEDILASGSLAVSPGDDLPTMPFDLYALDEDGLETDELIVIDSAFLAVMTFNNDDIAQIYPVCGDGAVYPADPDVKNPYVVNGYMMLEEGEDLLFIRPPFNYYTDNSRTELCAVTDWMWMVDAVFPWTYAVDGKNTVQVPVEGGTASFNISSYYSIEYFGYSFPEDCDWIDFENATLDNNQELGCQVLNIPVAALPEGVQGRSVTIDVEGAGTSLQLVINQGEGAGVNVVAVDKNAQYFDLQGRRVANPEKGIFIKKVGNKAEKVIL